MEDDVVTVEKVYQCIVDHAPVSRNGIAARLTDRQDIYKATCGRVTAALRALKAAGKITQSGNTRAAVYTEAQSAAVAAAE